MNLSEQDISEEILLVSDDDNAGQPDPAQFRHITGQLLQDSKWKMQRKLFRIHADKYISVKEQSLTAAKKFWIPLAHLDATPEHIKFINWRLGLGAFITLQLAILVLYLKFSVNLGSWSAYTTAPVTLLLTASLVLLALTIYTSTNHFVFRSRYGRHPIAVVLNNLPSKQECQQFIQTLSERIEQAGESGRHDKSRQLAAELSELRRLRDTAAISNEEYAQAKHNIFSHH